MEDRTLPSTWVVSNTADSGPGSLRQAILDTDANAGENTIDFAIPGTGVQTIPLASALPAITEPALIDGYSQPGASPNTDAEGDNAVLQVVLNGSSAGYVDGLTLSAPAITVRGLLITGFYTGVHLLDPTGQDIIAGNVISGGASDGFANYTGIYVDGSGQNTIGGTTPADRNIVTGNYYGNVTLEGTNAVGNLIEGNFVGVYASGTAPPALSGDSSGISLFTGASGNVIGGTALGAGNVIAANPGDGIEVSGATGNLIEGNLIGTDSTGTVALGNGGSGVEILLASGNTVGGTGAGAGNVIANNAVSGVVVTDSTAVRNRINANEIFGNGDSAIDLGDGGSANAPAPRQGANQLQNFPILVQTADGQLEGTLAGSTPDTLFHLDFFASASLSASGLGEAEVYLGSLDVTTDGEGQADFAVPFTPPADKPIVTATATDPNGNTSEVSGLRQATLQAPQQTVPVVLGQPLIFSTATGHPIALQDPDVGSLAPVWNLTFSVASGTLTLSTTDGLTGYGNDSGAFSYSGTLSALDAALAGLRYDAPQGHFFTTASLVAGSFGAPTLQAQLTLGDGVFVVTTTADSGPGSLRQAILESNTVTGFPATIDFAIPGKGVQTIMPASPLPTISNAVLIDGWSQPGFTGAPLIELTSQAGGGLEDLSSNSASVTVRGLAIHPSAGGNVDTYQIDATSGERLVAQVHAESTTARLLLLDAQGQLLQQSDGQAQSNVDALIDVDIPAGTVFLDVIRSGATGTYTLTTTTTPSTTPFQPIPLQSSPNSMVAGDFGGDGRTDLAIPDGFSDISVLLGDGDGTFQPAVEYAVVSDPTSIVTGDFNGDGKLDLMVVSNSGSPTGDVSVLLGNGDGTFQPQKTFAMGINASAPVVGDFNGDGRPDVAFLAYAFSAGTLSDYVSVFLGNGDGTFQAPRTFAAGLRPRGMVAGDFNGDGKLDLAVADEGMDELGSGGVSVLLGNGDGTFQTPRTFAAGASPYSIADGDFNGDGKLDLAVANSFSQDVSVLLGNGDGTFQSQQRLAVAGYPSSLVVGDFNDDGKLDLATPGAVLLGNGDGTFQAPKPFAPVESLGLALVTGDFNGDGRLDLVTESSGNLSVLLGNGDGTFQTTPRLATGQYPSTVVTGDFNGDGRLDLACTTGGTVSILLGNGDGTFQPAQQVVVGQYSDALAVGDFNGDGRLDLVVAESGISDSLTDYVYVAGSVLLLLGNGDGTFQAPKAIDPGTFEDPTGLVAGDFNGDGRLDLAVAENGNLFWKGTVPAGVVVALGNGDGTFQPPARYAIGGTAGIGELVVGDFRGDGRFDLAAANYDSNTISVLLGNGDGTFQAQQEYAATTLQTYFFALTTGDFNGDGKLDLAVTSPGYGGNPNSLSILLGNGNGTFQPPLLTAVPGLTSVVAGDFNGDGKLDLAVADVNSNTVWVLQGNGDGTFQAPNAFAVGQSPAGLVAGDFNGDGKLDLATANFGEDDISVLLGNGDETFSDPLQLATTLHAAPVLADVRGDGTDDVLVVDAAGTILDRQGIPGRAGTFDSPVAINPGFPSRDIALIPIPGQVPIVASVDARDDDVSLFAWRGASFVRIGSLSTGREPAQVIAADLNGDGRTDLVVRNAGDGTLSVFFSTLVAATNPPVFLPPVTLFVGLGVSDVQAADTKGNGRLDLMVTNKLTGQVGILQNLGDRTYASLVPYRAGTGLSAIDPGGAPEFTSLEGTAGVAAGSLTPGSPLSLVTINPGSNTLDVLAGLGRGRFANPVALQTRSPAQVERLADFNHDGILDLAFITSDGVSVAIGNGKGGFDPPVTYEAGPDPSGLTIADVNHDGNLDLLVSDPLGDVLVLLGQGDGTFQPYHSADQAVALAVVDLTGNGKPDFIYADQGLDRVVVQYGTSRTSVLGDRTSGLLSPGAVTLADMNGDGIPDLIIANSGSNNVLVYPGLGNGQFGPALNGGHGFFAGTNPTGITVANLNGQPDLIVANAGSNDVSILLGQGQRASWTLTPGPRIKTDAGPVAVAVGNILGTGEIDLAVANRQADNVEVFPGVGSGFFNDQKPITYAVGQAPVGLFLGNFGGSGLGLATLNSGSNDGTLITGLASATPQTNAFSTGGARPTTGFAGDFTGSGFTDLVVGNGDGTLALLLGGSSGLSLSQTLTSAEIPSPSGLSFAGVSNGLLNFYVSTAGREAAVDLAFDLSAGSEAGTPSVTVTPGEGLATAGVLAQATSGSVQQAAPLLTLTGSTLDLAATLLTVSVIAGDTEAALAMPAQSLNAPPRADGSGESDVALDEDPANSVREAPPAAETLSPWERLSSGLERAWESARAGILGSEGRLPASERQKSSTSGTANPPGSAPTQPKSKAGTESDVERNSPAAAAPLAPASAPQDRGKATATEAVDAALEALRADREGDNRGVGMRKVRAEDDPDGSVRAMDAFVGAAVAAAAWRARANELRRRRWAQPI